MALSRAHSAAKAQQSFNSNKLHQIADAYAAEIKSLNVPDFFFSLSRFIFSAKSLKTLKYGLSRNVKESDK